MTRGEGGISRRGFLGVAAAGTMAVALAACSSGDGPSASSRVTQMTDRPDPGSAHRVVIVGAGLAGLTAAHDLRAQGWEIVVLEARDRVGGRVFTRYGQVDGVSFDAGLHAEGGGESIDDNHDQLQALLRAYDIGTERRQADREAKGLVRYQAGVTSLSDFVALRGGAVAADYARFSTEVQKLTDQHRVDPEHPDHADGADVLDAQSLAQFVESLDLVPEARFLVERENVALYASELSDISMLFVAQQTAAVAGVPDGASETMRIVGGNSALPLAMAVALGDAVVTGAPVTTIAHDGDGVTVTAGDHVVHAAHVVLALPPPPLRRVVFDPPLPAPLQAAIAGLDLGPAVKVTSQYHSPFWRDAGHSGLSVADLDYRISWDATDSYAAAAGLLSTFTTGASATRLAGMSDASRIALVQSQIDQVYAGALAEQSGPAATLAWPDETFTGGGYAVYKPGQLSTFWAPIRDGAGRVVLAGEHTEALAGYMESAVRSGHRAATRIGPPA
jgi:monoamine oxidase